MADKETLADTLSYYTGPHLGGFLKNVLNLGNELNPVNSVGRSMAASRDQVFAPGKTPMERVKGVGDMTTGMAEVLAPALAGKVARLPAGELADTLSEGLTGLSSAVSKPVGTFARGEAGNVPVPGATAPVAPRRSGTGDLFYSQAEKVARELPQSKGTVGQFRAQLLKQGVKPDELLWSGFDRIFPDPNTKIARDEITSFFRGTDLPVSKKTLQSEGTVGQPKFSDSEAYNSFYESEMYDNYDLRDRARGAAMEELDGTYVGKIREDDPEAYQALVDEYGEDALDDDYFLTDDGELVSDLDQYLEDYGDLDRKMDDMISESWEDWGREQAKSDHADAGMFNPGDTQYSENFTRGADNYQENLFNVTPEARDRAFEFPSTKPYRAPHFAPYNADLALHTRAGELPMGTTGRETAYHLGEVQSDYAQKNRGKLRTPEQEQEFSDQTGELYKARKDLQKQNERLSDLLAENAYDQTLATRANNAGTAGMKDVLLDPDLPRFDQQFVLDAFARVPEGQVASPLSYGRGSRYHYFYGPVSPWDPTLQSSGNLRTNRYDWAAKNQEPRVQGSFYNDATEDGRRWPRERENMFSSEDMNLPKEGPWGRMTQDELLLDKAERNSAYYGANSKEPALPLGYTGRQRELADVLSAQKAQTFEVGIQERQLDDLGWNKVPAAPYVTNTDKFVDMGLKQGLADALQGSPHTMRQYDAMTLSNPRMVEEMTYLPGDAGSSGKFYGSIVPKRMQALLDKVAPGHKVEEIYVQTENGGQNVPGVMLTDELRRAIEENGIPFYSLGGGMVALGTAGATQQEREPGT